MEQTETLIVEQLKKGKERAYRYLFDRHYQVLCHVAAQYEGDDFVAETIVSDVLFHTTLRWCAKLSIHKAI